MPPSQSCPVRTTPAPLTTPDGQIIKPPLPTGISRIAHRSNDAEVLVPPLIAGALVAAFAKAVAEGLGNELLTHYYLTGDRVRVNVDRVLDRLVAEFTRCLWDELFDFYTASDQGFTRQIALLFDGPIRQLVLVLNGPETAACLLEHLGPGLSRRKSTWSQNATGIDLALGLQLICGYWHREHPTLSPGGSPEEIARVLSGRLVNGVASRNLVQSIRQVLLSPHYLQMHILETAIWDLILKRRQPPPRDGFHVVQFRFECQFGLESHTGTQDMDIGAMRAITGTQTECAPTTVLEYVDRHWQRCGRLVLSCLNDAVVAAHRSAAQGDTFDGMAIWDGSDGKGAFCPGLRLLHFEVENGFVQLSVCAWAHTHIEVFQQMAWTCAALGASPFPGTTVESAVEVIDSDYSGDSMFFNCSMAHQPVVDGEGAPWLRAFPGSSIARGFPVILGPAEEGTA